jgi:hypothetical protein
MGFFLTLCHLYPPPETYCGFHRLFTIPLTGGLASEVPLPRAEEGSYSPDGSHLAYGWRDRGFGVCGLAQQR